MANFSVNVLGCGSAKPTLRHNPSCTVLNIRECLYMIDCGEGVQRQMMRMRLKFNRLRHIFLTHLHGDHVLGLTGLLSTLSLQQMQGYIRIYTFKEGIKWINSQMTFFGRGLSYDLEFVEIDPVHPMLAYENKYLTVRTLPLQHSVPCVGYVVEEKPNLRHINREMCDFHSVPLVKMQALQRGEDFVKPDGTVLPNAMLTKPPTPSVSYAHIGDTSYMPDIASRIGPVDLLYHEATYTAEHMKDARERGHSTAAQAAMVARDCGAKQLLLGHFSSRYKDERPFLDEAKPIFEKSVLANEGLSISL